AVLLVLGSLSVNFALARRVHPPFKHKRISMTPIDVLKSVSSIDAFADLVRSGTWKDYLASLAKRRDATEEVEQLRRALADAKNRLSPEHTCAELQALKARVYTEGGDAKAQRPLLLRISEIRAALPLRRHHNLFSQVETALGQMFSPGLGGSGYSNRARRAS